MGYRWPHDEPYDDENLAADQVYLGVESHYYLPTGRGAEARMADYLQKIKQKAAAATVAGKPDPQGRS